MDRRKEHRSSRRLSVRFWRPGEDSPSTCLTANVSAHGLFIATNRPARSGERVRVEVGEPASSFVVEGVVTHSHLIPPELRRVQLCGMGVRMLSIDELLGGACGPRKEPTVPLRAVETMSAPTAPSPPAPAPVATAASVLGDGAYLVRFASRERFLEVLRRDLQFGEFFVPTMHPPKVGETVTLELEIPGAEAHRERFVGKVVQRVLPLPQGAASSPSPGLAGFSVELLERSAAVGRLRRFL